MELEEIVRRTIAEETRKHFRKEIENPPQELSVDFTPDLDFNELDEAEDAEFEAYYHEHYTRYNLDDFTSKLVWARDLSPIDPDNLTEQEKLGICIRLLELEATSSGVRAGVFQKLYFDNYEIANNLISLLVEASKLLTDFRGAAISPIGIQGTMQSIIPTVTRSKVLELEIKELLTSLVEAEDV